MRRSLTLLVLPALAASGCFGGPAFLPAVAETFGDATGVLLTNGTVWTADDARPWASAVAIQGNRIVAVGTDADVLRADVGPRPLRVDLAGRMVLPGFHDTHNHFAEVARAWDPASSPTNPYEPWPPGWDPVQGTVRQQLVAANHIGVWADHNRERIEQGRLPAPPARLHGLVHHDHGPARAHDLWFGPPEHENAAPAWEANLRLGLATAARFGLTSSVEAGTDLQTFEILGGLRDRDELTLRFNLYVFPEDLDMVLARGWTLGAGDEHVRLLGLKIYADGWLGPRTAALRDLYNDRPHQGFAFFTLAEVDELVQRAHEGGLKVTAHAIGDRAAAMMLTAYERAKVRGCPPDAAHVVCRDPRYTLEHVQLLQPDLVDRVVALPLVPSIQLSFATSDAPWAESALGSERLRHAYVWRTLHERGIVLGGSSDFPIEALPPLWGVQRAVTRVDLNGFPEGGFMREQALDLDTALRTITIHAAYLQFREHELGSLTPGKLADVVVLERDLFAHAPQEIAATAVHLTLVDGRPAYATDAMAAPFGFTAS
jgi:predicted amidohydrolase YtcJ